MAPKQKTIAYPQIQNIAEKLKEEYLTREPRASRGIRTTRTVQELEVVFVAMIKELVADAKDLPRIRGTISAGKNTVSFQWSHYTRGGGHLLIQGAKGKDVDYEVRPAEYKIPRLQKFKTRVKVPATLNAAQQKALTEQIDGLFS